MRGLLHSGELATNWWLVCRISMHFSLSWKKLCYIGLWLT